MDEKELETSLETYRVQLNQVELALTAAGCDNADLVQLQKDLKELVGLTEASLLSLKKSKLLSILDGNAADELSQSNNQKQPEKLSAFDAEFAAFQVAISSEDTSAPGSSNSPADTKSKLNSPPQDQGCNFITAPLKDLSSQTTVETHSVDDPVSSVDTSWADDIIGTKCRAPFRHEWGTFQYHNAMIVEVKPIQHDTQPRVRVLFCHPTHRSMLPCPFYLDGRCRFTDDECRFSHGYDVDVEELKEYLEPDFSLLCIDSDCLAKDADDVWYKAKVTEVNGEGHGFEVMFESNNSTASVDVEDIVPLEIERESEDSDDDEDNCPLSERDSDLSDDEELPVFLWKPGMNTSAMADWEAHTKGIGSKLMIKMGYIMGQGLGINRDGRSEPVPIQLLPSGKSLDKIMELKEIAGDRNLYDVMKQQERKRKKADKKAQKTSTNTTEKSTMFDVINKKLGHKKGNIHDLVKHAKHNSQSKVKHITEKDLGTKSDKEINIQMMRTHDEIRNIEKEIVRLKEALSRNDGKNNTVASQLRQKLVNMERYLKQIQTSEKSLQNHHQSRKDHKKLVVF